MNWYPKRLSSDAAQRHADVILLIIPDLAHVAACCKELLDREQHPLQGPFGGDTIVQALFDAAVIRYRRCFNKGVRTRLISLLDELSPEERQLHQFFYDLGDMHIAHSVNGFEQAHAVIYINDTSPEVVLRQPKGGIGASGHLTLQLTLQTIQQLGILVDRLKDLARKWAGTASEEVLAEVQAMSDDQLRALPCGATMPAAERVDKARASPSRRRPRERVGIDYLSRAFVIPKASKYWSSIA